MICPKCKQDMIVVERQQIELDYCPNCEGVWFDADELYLLLQSLKTQSRELEIQEILRLPALESSGNPVKCPICSKKMKEVAIGQPAINIDVCVRADGLWFDGGEVNQLLRQLRGNAGAGAESGQSMFDFIGEMFQGKE